MAIWLQAGLWGLVAGGALVIGAAVAWLVSIPRTVAASVMAFGAGSGGLGPTIGGFMAGAVAYVAANLLLARRGARHRKRSGVEQGSEADVPGSGAAIAVGALLDGIPESVVLGLSLLGGGGVGVPVLAAIFISNLPEGLSSTAGMKRNGRSAGYVFGVWGGIAVASGLAGLLGCLLLEGASDATVAGITALAAGAILAMISDTMIPEAFERTHMYAGLLATTGFLVAFTISRVS
jgi:ZIP family zinc transporter